MELKEIQELLHRYFSGESSATEEKKLAAYFARENIADEVAEYAAFFSGIEQLANVADTSTIEEDVMDYILENELREKMKYRSMWKMATGIAASIIIVLSGFLFYQERQKPFKDSFDTPEEAYAYATQTLGFVSKKYNKGLAQLSNFEKLSKANASIKKGTAPLVEFYEGIEKLKKGKQVQWPFSEIDSM